MRGDIEDVVFHAQIATDTEGRNVRVITMYFPAREEWDSEFRTRRSFQK
jgi:hypothetical protein